MIRELELYHRWLEAIEDPEHKAELEALQGDEAEIGDRFYRDLEFGTAGLRGVLGLGTNRMNVYTVRRTTQGLAEYLLEQGGKASAAIAYDSRNLSDVFARETACVLAANGIRVHLYRELMPTPALSYAVREFHCDTGVVITASHNPAKYNGYKVYGSDGCQIGPEIADRVTRLIGETDLFRGIRTMPLQQGLDEGLISYIPDRFVEQYVDRVLQEAIQPDVCVRAGLKLVYTPLNGAGNRCVQEVLKKAGVADISVVPEQERPDGDFPTCPYPNPEIRETLDLGMKLCREKDADLLLATDPDCDRVAVAVKNGGDYQIISGNELGVLLLDYIAKARKAKGTMPQNPVAVKSIVSTKLADCVAREHGVEMVDVLTGFKFIGEVIHSLEEKGEEERFLLGFEESCGYLTGPYVRDKDAVDASLLAVEMASAYKLEGKSLVDVLEEIFARHGVYSSKVSSFAFEGADGMKQMAGMMASLRDNPPVQIAGTRVTCRTDYQSSSKVENGIESAIAQHKSNVLEYGLADGCTVIVRPSGTEPKIKLYYSIAAPNKEEVEMLAQRYSKACEALLGLS